MCARVILLTPARQFIANKYGLGYQIPLGLVLLGGPLIDAGHDVHLIDNDAYGWSLPKLSQQLQALAPDYILIGHTGSTAAHTTCLQTATAVRQACLQAKIVYGGVYPSYNAQASLDQCPALDVIVCGEGEQTILDLIDAWENNIPMETVAGLVTREHGQHPRRPPLRNLDDYRPGWELVDWPQYELFGVGRSAGMQFSRGCPLTCTYCGQWLFWKKWRHRSPQNFVDQLTILATQYDVKIVWLADENFGADREVTIDLLTRLTAANLDLSLNINMTAADVVRDQDILPLYKAAGVDYVVMGVESLEDEVITTIRKNNPFQISKEAVASLRQNGIISLVNIIYGLETESIGTLRTKLRKIGELDPDILNAVYITPHFWTKDGRNTNLDDIIQTDSAKWTYRNQIIHTPHLSPAALFWGVKVTEALFHLRWRGVRRLFNSYDRRTRRILRYSMWVGIKTVLAEIYEFVFDTEFSPRGQWVADKEQAEINNTRLGTSAITVN
ncbi:MAG TPA: radical SAM protein [Anaerolineae bacterium]|nr:radical SAM protein [Anaerolineae bacterium]